VYWAIYNRMERALFIMLLIQLSKAYNTKPVIRKFFFKIIFQIVLHVSTLISGHYESLFLEKYY